jgi:hypothetical protein
MHQDEQPDSLDDGGLDDPALPVLAAQPVPAPRAAAPPLFPARARSTGVPVAQAAVVAAGSFVAGAAVAGLVRRRRSAPALAGRRAARSLTRRRSARSPKGPEVLEVVASRKLLVDVHLLGLPASER